MERRSLVGEPCVEREGAAETEMERAPKGEWSQSANQSASVQWTLGLSLRQENKQITGRSQLPRASGEVVGEIEKWLVS